MRKMMPAWMPACKAYLTKAVRLDLAAAFPNTTARLMQFGPWLVRPDEASEKVRSMRTLGYRLCWAVSGLPEDTMVCLSTRAQAPSGALIPNSR